ncbi:MAG: helix-turn-helix domain-containing protein [Anaeroplasma bactoclasticum]|nr:helix-turn-helix domain-containing protein [Anaeroplasma bactoclasticum]
MTRLKELIETKGLSRKQVAKDLFIEKRTLDNYINDTTKMNSEMIVRVAKYFNVTTDYLLNADINCSSLLLKKIDKLAYELKEFVIILNSLKD